MKKFLLFFFAFTFLCFVGCGKTETISAQNMEYRIAEEIEGMENSESFDDETVKALSVLIRGNILSGKENVNLNNEYTGKNEHILKLTKDTAGEVLLYNDKLVPVKIENGEENQTWQTEIKKSEILNFLNQNGISLSNISKISPKINERGEFEGLLVAEKLISYSDLKETFGLKSNKILDVKNNLSSIIVVGEGTDADGQTFNPNLSKKMAGEGKTYTELLNHFFERYEVKTIKN